MNQTATINTTGLDRYGKSAEHGVYHGLAIYRDSNKASMASYKGDTIYSSNHYGY